MHKFYWRNTHGPGAAQPHPGTRPEQTYYRMGKSGSADNILSESSVNPRVGCDSLPGSGLSLVRRMRRLSGRGRPRSVADIADVEDDLAQNLANLRLTNSQAVEYNSIEHLEAAQYGQSYTRPQYSAGHYAQVRSCRSAQLRARTWNQQSVARYRQETEFCPSRNKRLSVSSFRFEDSPASPTSPTNPLPQSDHRAGFREKMQRSLSCDRTKHASKQVVKSIKISSDKIQENLTKISSNLNSRLDTLSCMAGEEEGLEAGGSTESTDWYRPPDCSAAWGAPVRLTTPSSSLGRHQQQDRPQSPTSSISTVFSCTRPQCEEMANMDRLSHTMRGKMHTANKKLSMIRSKSMERFSKRNPELIVVTPRERNIEKPSERSPEWSGPVLGQAVAIMDFTPNPYDREALSLRRGDLIDVIETNPNGTWRGRCNGRVGSFKFLTVQTLPARGPGTLSQGGAGRVSSVQEVLSLVGLDHFLSVFILNGYDSLASLCTLDRAGLDYLGLTDSSKQTELLRTISSLLGVDTLRDSGCYSGAVGSSSGESERSETPRSRRSRGHHREAVMRQELSLTSDI